MRYCEKRKAVRVLRGGDGGVRESRPWCLVLGFDWQALSLFNHMCGYLARETFCRTIEPIRIVCRSNKSVRDIIIIFGGPLNFFTAVSRKNKTEFPIHINVLSSTHPTHPFLTFVMVKGKGGILFLRNRVLIPEITLAFTLL